MTPHRLLNIALTLAVALLIALPLSLAHLLDKHPDRRSESAQANALADAQQAARQAARKEAGARHECSRAHGPQAAVRWVDDVQYVCTDRTGRTATVIAKGATP